MEVGSAETLLELEKARKRRSGLGGGNSGNGSRNPGSGGSGNGHDDDPPPDTATFLPNKSRILMWFLLLVVMMTFGGLISTYVVISTNRAAEWNPFDLPIQVWISTALILLSSLTYYLAEQAVFRESQRRAKKWLLVTTVLGAAFISSQILAWLELSGRGVYVAGNPYAGLFYILTAVHAAHVLGGIIALGSVLLKTWNYVGSDAAWHRLQIFSQVVGWYWHFMGVLWLILFALLGFWK